MLAEKLHLLLAQALAVVLVFLLEFLDERLKLLHLLHGELPLPRQRMEAELDDERQQDDSHAVVRDEPVEETEDDQQHLADRPEPAVVQDRGHGRVVGEYVLLLRPDEVGVFVRDELFRLELLRLRGKGGDDVVHPIDATGGTLERIAPLDQRQQRALDSGDGGFPLRRHRLQHRGEITIRGTHPGDRLLLVSGAFIRQALQNPALLSGCAGVHAHAAGRLAVADEALQVGAGTPFRQDAAGGDDPVTRPLLGLPLVLESDPDPDLVLARSREKLLRHAQAAVESRGELDLFRALLHFVAGRVKGQRSIGIDERQRTG